MREIVQKARDAISGGGVSSWWLLLLRPLLAHWASLDAAALPPLRPVKRESCESDAEREGARSARCRSRGGGHGGVRGVRGVQQASERLRTDGCHVSFFLAYSNGPLCRFWAV